MIVFRLARAAQADVVGLLVTALRDVAAQPERTNSMARSELGENVRSYHLRHSRERARTEHGIVVRPRHLMLHRFGRADLVGIGRVLTMQWRSTGIFRRSSATSEAGQRPRFMPNQQSIPASSLAMQSRERGRSSRSSFRLVSVAAPLP